VTALPPNAAVRPVMLCACLSHSPRVCGSDAYVVRHTLDMHDLNTFSQYSFVVPHVL
jgi:hypothetical protein